MPFVFFLTKCGCPASTRSSVLFTTGIGLLNYSFIQSPLVLTSKNKPLLERFTAVYRCCCVAFCGVQPA